MTVVLTIVVSTARSIRVLQDNLKRIAHLILMARSITQKSGGFLFYKILPDAICRHPSSSCFFSHHWIVIKNFVHELQSSNQCHARLPVVRSTTAGITTCASCGAAFMQCHTSLAVVPIKKLLQYSCFQGHGVIHHHLVGSCPQHHPYHIILHKCGHIAHDSSLAGTSSHLCGTVLYPVQFSQCTTI